MLEVKQMNAPNYPQIIVEGIQGLPPTALSEIADFVYLLRRRVFDPNGLAAEQRSFFLAEQLSQMSRDEWHHFSIRTLLFLRASEANNLSRAAGMNKRYVRRKGEWQIEKKSTHGGGTRRGSIAPFCAASR